MRIIGITDVDEIDEITFIIKTKEEIYYFTKANQHPEIAKKVIKGMTKIRNENDLYNTLKNQDKNCMNIIVPRTQNISFNIIKKFFFENSYLFSDSSLNFIQIPHDLAAKMNIQTGEFLIYNEILSQSNSSNNDENILRYKFIYENDSNNLKEDKELSFIRINIFTQQKFSDILVSSKEFTKESAFSFISLDFDCQVRDELIKYYKALDIGFEELTDFLKFLLNPNINNQKNYPTILRRKVYQVETLQLASFYKKQFFQSKENFLYIYMNDKNSEYTTLNNDLLNKIIDDTLTQLNNELKGDKRMNSLRVIVTKNPEVNNMFLIFPKSKENLTIRYIDYGKVVYYNSPIRQKNKYLIKDLSNDTKFISDLSENEKNYVFPLKYNFSEKNFNSKTLKDFMIKCFRNKFENYLEEEEVGDQITTIGKRQLLSLSPQNFEKEIIKNKGKKIIMIIDPNGVGSIMSSNFMLNFMNLKQEYEIKYFIYNKYNDNLMLKKFNSVPHLIVYEDDKIIKEINVYKIFSEELNPFEALTNQLEKLL